MESKIVKADAGRKIVKQEVFDAHAEAREIVARAEAERDGIFEAARREGYEQGLREWNEAVAAVEAERDSYLRGCEQEVLKLAVQIARKIVGEQLRLNPDSIVSIVREAMRSVRRERELTIQVHPDAVDEVRRRIREIDSERSIEVTGNADISPGGCVIVTELGTIDARLETQLRSMERALQKGPR